MRRQDLSHSIQTAKSGTIAEALHFMETLGADGRFTVPFSAPTTQLEVKFDLSALQTK